MAYNADKTYNSRVVETAGHDGVSNVVIDIPNDDLIYAIYFGVGASQINMDCTITNLTLTKLRDL